MKKLKKIKEKVLRHDYLKHFFVGFFIFQLAEVFLIPLYAFVIVLVTAIWLISREPYV